MYALTCVRYTRGLMQVQILEAHETTLQGFIAGSSAVGEGTPACEGAHAVFPARGRGKEAGESLTKIKMQNHELALAFLPRAHVHGTIRTQNIMNVQHHHCR